MAKVARIGAYLAGAAVLALPIETGAASVCGARVTVRQIGMTANEDGSRTLRYRASVETDQAVCAKVSFTIIRSYLKPDGAAVEDAIPVEVQVPGRAVDVEGETLANTRRLVYWRAEKVSCQLCPEAEGAVPAAPVPSSTRRTPASDTRTAPASEGGGAKIGKKAVIAGGAVAVVAAGAVVASGGSSTGSGEEPTPTARPTATATATATPTSAPTATPTPEGPRVFPGAPPAAPSNTETGDVSLLGLDPPAGSSVPGTRGAINGRFQLYLERIGTDMRLEVQFWSGGEMCVRDVSAPLELKANQPLVITFVIPNVRRCTPPFRTTLLRALLNDRGTTKVAQDFPVNFDFLP